VAVAPLLFTGALGLAAIGLELDSIHHTGSRIVAVAGLLLAGVAFGGLQNLTLAQAFTAAGERARSTVSIAWNLSFDAGTGLGAIATGAIATATSYSAAFLALAVVVAIVGACWGLPRLARRSGRGRGRFI
jgi:predicted MFS family arabinose efflux permease